MAFLGRFQRFFAEKKKASPSQKSEPSKPDAAPVEEQEESLSASLSLPEEHPFTRLRTLCNGTPGVLSLSPALDPPEGPALLSAKEAASELLRLENFVASTAKSRMKQADETFQPVDAQVLVFLPINHLSAWVLAYPPLRGGAELSGDMVRKALETARVCYGLDEALPDQLSADQNRYFHLFLAARGQPPVHGKDGHTIDFFSRTQKPLLVEDETGRVNFAARELFQNVKKGDIICRIVPPVQGSDGVTVLNHVLPARPGRNVTVPKGRNTELSEDKECLLALCDGHVEFDGRRFLIKSVLEINGNVDASTGNVVCPGDVCIHGDVCSGFSVRATGTVAVDGMIDACVVEAGADLVCRKGVQGNNRAILRIHRNVYAQYLENVTVYVQGDVDTECVVNSAVFSNGAVRVRSGRGVILGGEIHAAREVSANVVGSRAECLTAIFLGGRPFEQYEREDLKQEIEEYKKTQQIVSRQPESPEKQRKLSRLRIQIAANKRKLHRYDEVLASLQEEEKDPVPGQLLCGIAYPGTEITIGAANLRVYNETRKCVTSLDHGEIVLLPTT